MASPNRSAQKLTGLVWAVMPYLLLAGLVWFELTTILANNGGHFTYSLDDPYIHLALAERIATGHYGINPGQAAAPSSSVIWPFLLAPLAWLPGFDLVPLGVNLLLAGLTVYVYTKIAAIITDGLPAAPALTGLLTLALIPATNVVGLAFTGMEHSLQQVLCAAVVLGMIKVLGGQPAPKWLIPALIAAPLTRYEALAVILPALAGLVFCRLWRTAAAAFAGMAVGLGAFSVFLYTRGLGWLPTSVFAKVSFAAYQPTPNFIADHLRNNLTLRQGTMLAWLVILLTLLAVIRFRAAWAERGMALAAAAGGLAHLAAGQIGWMDRYEVYMIAAALLWVLYFSRAGVQKVAAALGWPASAGVLAVLSLLVGLPYYANLSLTPGAALNIYEQQYQMHRLAVDYVRGPVAVNDLGWVAYRNPYPVLDLWGLASREALKSRTRSGPYQVAWMDALVQRESVRLVMIYSGRGWFPTQPERWVLVGRLHLGHPQVSAGGDTVSFYVPDPLKAGEMRALLREFAPTLPPTVRLELD